MRKYKVNTRYKVQNTRYINSTRGTSSNVTRVHCAQERARVSVCVCVWGGGGGRAFVRVCVCVCVGGGGRACVCARVCVCDLT